MGAREVRERRPALWPYLVMPLVVLVVFYALFRVHQGAAVSSDSPPAETRSEP
jgi:hypothetical protein